MKKAESKKGGRGGSRPGAGRKTKDGITKTKRVNVSLDAETLDKAQQIGAGNVSEGVRRAIKRFKLSTK